MSFILDALKKSEVERQRQSIPGLIESGPLRPRPRLPLWAIALGTLLAVNLLVLLVVLGRGWMGQAPEDGSGARADPDAAPPAAAANHAFSPLDGAAESPVYAPEIPVTAAPAPPLPAKKSSASGATHVERRRDPLLSDGDYKAGDEEPLPTINEINLTGAQALPELHLDVHVFATQTAERFVYINMRKYHEGATLQEGPTVERIRRDGVILDYANLRFLLPRQ